jgi:6-phosphogluconolactonase
MNKLPQDVVVLNSSSWAESISKILDEYVRKIVSKDKKCKIIMTAGKSAVSIYSYFLNAIKDINRELYFYLSDERFVDTNHFDSNFRSINSIFDRLNNCKSWHLERFQTELPINDAISNYNILLKDHIDILLISVADDGHIASIFPGDKKIHLSNENFTLSNNINHPHLRGTITPKLIANTKKIFVFVKGHKKGKLVNKMLNNHIDYVSMPSSLLLSGTWLFDDEAFKCINKEL